MAKIESYIFFFFRRIKYKKIIYTIIFSERKNCYLHSKITYNNHSMRIMKNASRKILMITYKCLKKSFKINFALNTDFFFRN